MRLTFLVARNQTHVNICHLDVRGAWDWNDVWTERGDPGDAQLGSGHVLFLRNVGQGVDDSKVVPHRLQQR